MWPYLESHVLHTKPIFIAPAGLSRQKKFYIFRILAAEKGQGLKEEKGQDNSHSALQCLHCHSHPLDITVLKAKSIPPQLWLLLFGTQLPFPSPWIVPRLTSAGHREGQSRLLWLIQWIRGQTEQVLGLTSAQTCSRIQDCPPGSLRLCFLIQRQPSGPLGLSASPGSEASSFFFINNYYLFMAGSSLHCSMRDFSPQIRD